MTRTRRVRHRLTAAALATGLLLAGCAGGGNEVDQPTDPDGAMDGSEDGSGDGSDGAMDDAPMDDGVSRATFTVDGQTYEFTSTGFPTEQCDPDLFGGFFVVLSSPEQTNGFTLKLPGPEWAEQGRDDPATAEVIVGDRDLVADESKTWPAVADGDSRILDFSFDGNRAQGSGSFIDSERAVGTDPVEPVTATFEVVCAAS